MTDTLTRTDLVATVSGFALKNALAAVKPAVAKARQYGLPVLSGVRIEADDQGVTVSATDLDLTVSVRIPGATVGDAGVIVAPFADVAAYVAKLTVKNDPTVTITGGGCKIAGFAESVTLEREGRVRTLGTLPADEWPRMDDAPDTGRALVNAGMFADVLPAASSDDCRPILTGVYMGGGLVAACDSYRLYVSTGGPVGEEDGDILVPARAVREIVRHAKGGMIRLGWTEREFVAEIGSVTVRTRLIDGEFPRFQSLIPHERDIRARYLFTDTARTVATIADVATIGRTETSIPIRIAPADSGSGTWGGSGTWAGIGVTMTVQDVGTDTAVVPGEITGDPPEVVAFNAGYLSAMLKDLPAGPFVLQVVDHLKPATVRHDTADGRTLTRILMPVRV